jgi:DNA polymerase-3 subunit delta
MAAQKGITHEDIVRDVRAGKIAPIYYLMGDEPYYIDKVSDFIVDAVLKPEERDFNLDIVYGADVTLNQVIELARAYPMMAERRVVLVREAQAIRSLDGLEQYALHLTPSTVLILCHKNGTLDRRTNMAKEIQKAGIVFESPKLKDYQLPGFVRSYVQRKALEIEPDACQILCEHVGADLNRLAGELDKLIVALGEHGRIDAQAIQDNIGISKEYNSFELIAALAEKDVMKANRIVKYFDSNPKNFALQPTLASLFKFYTELLLAYYAPNRSEEGIAAWLEQSTWQVRKNILPAMRVYTAMKVYTIIGEIRRTDGASKGVGGQKTSDGDLLKELVFMILH